MIMASHSGAKLTSGVRKLQEDWAAEDIVGIIVDRARGFSSGSSGGAGTVDLTILVEKLFDFHSFSGDEEFSCKLLVAVSWKDTGK